MLNLNDLHLFVRAVEAGGFAACSRRLHTPKSTISKRIAALESALGTQLLQRNARRFQLTEAGRAFLEHASAALIEAEAAENAVRRRIAEPAGIVKVTASVPTAQFYLADHLPALAVRYPKLQIVVHVTDRAVDLVEEGFDIAVRNHFAPLPDSSLIQRRIGSEPVLLVAAEAYLKRFGSPTCPEDLAGHEGLISSLAADGWRLRHGDVQRLVAPRPRFIADESIVLLKAAAAGMGIVCLPESICRLDLASGRLSRVLFPWTAGVVTTTVLMPDRRSALPGVRAVVSFLADHLRSPDDSTVAPAKGG